MSALSDFLAESLATTVGAMGETALVTVLQKGYEKDPVRYKSALLGGLSFIEFFKPFVDKTKTKIDDILLTDIGDAIKVSAETNGVKL